MIRGSFGGGEGGGFGPPRISDPRTAYHTWFLNLEGQGDGYELWVWAAPRPAFVECREPTAGITASQEHPPPVTSERTPLLWAGGQPSANGMVGALVWRISINGPRPKNKPHFLSHGCVCLGL